MLCPMARKKKKPKHEAHKVPSKILLEAKQQTGGGAHRESKVERNKRTGRLRGAEKKNLKGDYE